MRKFIITALLIACASLNGSVSLAEPQIDISNDADSYDYVFEPEDGTDDYSYIFDTADENYDYLFDDSAAEDYEPLYPRKAHIEIIPADELPIPKEDYEVLYPRKAHIEIIPEGELPIPKEDYEVLYPSPPKEGEWDWLFESPGNPWWLQDATLYTA